MLIFYIDESGHHSMVRDSADPAQLVRGSSHWFVLSAVGVRDTSRRPLAEALERIKTKHLEGELNSPWIGREIKGRRLSEARRRLSGETSTDPLAFPSITGHPALNALERDLARLFLRFRPLTFTVAIDKRALLARNSGESALGWAYAFLYRRIALTLERVYPGEGGVLVADQQAEHEEFFRSGALTGFRDELATTTPYRADYRLLLDRPLWIDSRLSTWDRELLQLADLVAFVTHEGLRSGFQGTSALWPAIRGTLAVDGNTGEPDQEGLVIYPKPSPWPSTRTLA